MIVIHKLAQHVPFLVNGSGLVVFALVFTRLDFVVIDLVFEVWCLQQRGHIHESFDVSNCQLVVRGNFENLASAVAT